MVTSAYFDIARCLAPCADTKRCRESQSLRRRVSCRCPEWAKLESGDACSRDADIYTHIYLHAICIICILNRASFSLLWMELLSVGQWQHMTKFIVCLSEDRIVYLQSLVSFLRQHNNPDNLTHSTPQQQWCYRYVAFPKISTTSKKKPQNDSARATN